MHKGVGVGIEFLIQLSPRPTPFSNRKDDASWERGFGRLLWGSDAARLRPEASVFRQRFFQTNAALFHKGQKQGSLFRGHLILCDVASFAGAIIEAVAFDMPSRAYFHLRCFVPERPVERKLLAESIFPRFASSNLEFLVLC